MVTIHRKTQPDGTLEVHFQSALRFAKDTPMLEQENIIQNRLNEVGLQVTRHLLLSLECDGKPLTLGPTMTRYTAKSKPVVKVIETPYGPLSMPRHVYQTSAGGACHVPLDKAASIIGNATPKFAQMISHKHTEANGRAVCHDMLKNHQRPISLEQVQLIAQRVGALAARHPSQLDEPELPPVEEKHTSEQVLDYYHAAGYLNEAGAAYYANKDKAAVWLRVIIPQAAGPGERGLRGG